MKYGLVMGLVGLALLGLACNEGNDRLERNAKIEGDASAKAELDVQTANFQRRAREMEEDLVVRHRFYQAVKGTYEGTVVTGQGVFNVRITLVPSLPPYTVDRTRQLEEIASDLNSLYFTAQAVQWNPADTLSAVGCRVEHVRPDLVNGEINIASSSCANLYALRLGEESNESASVALSIREGRVVRAAHLQGIIQPSTNALVYRLTANRVER